MAIVQRIAKLLDHPLFVRSRVGAGSGFGVQVPLVAVGSDTAPPPQDAKPAPSTGTLSGVRVTAVDDDAQGLAGLSELLRAWGCRVTALQSGEDIGRWMGADSAPPEIVIADFHLDDGATGLDVIERIRGRFKRDIPAFIVSSDRTAGLKTRVKAHGLILLEKPIQPAKLRALMSHLIKGPVKPGQ